MRTCVDCGIPVAGRSLRCQPHKAARNRAHVRDWKLRNPEYAKEMARQRYRANPEKQKQRAAEYRARFPEQVRERQQTSNRQHGRRYYLKSRYGITPEQFDSMFAAQSGKCAICRRKAGVKSSGSDRHKANEWMKGLVVDHCHVTGEVRGLLCQFCNVALGNLQDDPEIVRAAARYLETHRQLKLAI